MPNHKTPKPSNSTTLNLIGCLFIILSILGLIGFLSDGSFDGRLVGLPASGVLLAVGLSALFVGWHVRRS